MPLPLVYHADYVSPLPPKHRFPMPKFGKIYDWLIKDGIAGIDQFHTPQRAGSEWLELVHDRSYVSAYLEGHLSPEEMRRIGFPWSRALVQRTCTAIGGSILTAELALAHGLACNTAGGTHHAYSNFGSGYCIFNDMAIAARYVQYTQSINKVLIVDLDVHQGDGTASIFANDPSVTTFSIHCEKNFPFRKQRSDLDIGLSVGTQDDTYLDVLTYHMNAILDECRPQFVIYDAGVDPHEDDRLGKLCLSDNGLYRRDTIVLESCLSRDIPVAGVVGGGYDNDVDLLARRHTSLHRAAATMFDMFNLS